LTRSGRSPSRAAGWWRYLWASPTSAIGLLAIAVTASRVTITDGVLEAHGRGIAALFDLIAPRRGIDAMTLGHVVLGRSAAALAETRAHERVHVTQCERWGPCFLPAYAAASFWAWSRGGDSYRDNAFERSAFEIDSKSVDLWIG
jgi:hypothetical protein